MQVRDISDGGACCVASDEIPCDEEVVLFLPQLGGQGGRHVRCRVTRCEEIRGRFRMGLAFRNPVDEAGKRVH